MDSVVVCGGGVGKVNDGCRPSLCDWECEGVENMGMGPHEACRNTEYWKDGGEEGSEGGGEGSRGSVDGGRVEEGEGA